MKIKMKTNCDNCDSLQIRLTIRQGVRHCNVWRCDECGASVGCHEGTDIPLGKMAPADIRYMRVVAHQSFDLLWLTGLMSRERAKRWISDKLELGVNEFHISQCDYDQLVEVIKHSDLFMERYSETEISRLKEKNVERKTRSTRRIAKLSFLAGRRRKQKDRRDSR